MALKTIEQTMEALGIEDREVFDMLVDRNEIAVIDGMVADFQINQYLARRKNQEQALAEIQSLGEEMQELTSAKAEWWFGFECHGHCLKEVQEGLGTGTVLDVRFVCADNDPAPSVTCPRCGAEMTFKARWWASDGGYGSRGDYPVPQHTKPLTASELADYFRIEESVLENLNLPAIHVGEPRYNLEAITRMLMEKP